MTWSISHDGTKLGYSYSGIAELHQWLGAILTPADMQTVRPILNRPSGDPFKVKPKQAKQVGDALLLAAGYLPAGFAQMARQIGGSALRAASARESWRWS
ncbi:DUF7739 domain-containing protein [Streptomyces xanthophaeus]|uniref:DUF7739 domain-containing protein n=1 Tax=Streptomyces xanthophaeus TaxID=67385 RepID=UPI003721F369